MSDDRPTIDDLLAEARRLPAGSEREAWIESATAGDQAQAAALRERLAAGVDVHDSETAATADLPTAATLREGAGTVIGRYRLLQQIGEGGFGTVYLAEQRQPVKRRVALKIIKLGMDTKQVIGRFEAERQALAMMDHPNIAKVFDAGATDTGRPYFVMELVKGVPLTEYCDTEMLSNRARLELFIEVCNAVQHAHQKGIIHRDLKPSNVLVTMHDGTPVPKVIDFGIAKATSAELTEKTVFTEFRQLIGTPEYMSPEQAEMTGLDIDTRSDIYSLGVLLYEMLTGTTPFDPRELRKAALDEIQRIIREDEPERPSTRVISPTQSKRSGTSLVELARHRRTDPPALVRSLRGDLDWIVMRCLEKDRTRRYGSALELAEDVRRHLHDEPVVAGPPGARYRLAKFARRHRTAFYAGTAVAMALVLGVIVITASLVRAVRAERDLAAALVQAEENLEVAESNYQLARDAVDRYYLLVSEERLLEEPGMEELRRELLGSAGAFYATFVADHADDPTVRSDFAKTLERLAAITAATASQEEAQALLEDAEAQHLELLRERSGDPEVKLALAECRIDHAVMLIQLGRLDEAEERLEWATIDLETLVEEEPEAVERLFLLGQVLHRHAALYAIRADFEESHRLGQRAQSVMERVVQMAPSSAEYRSMQAVVLNRRGAVAFRQGRLDEAQAGFESAMTIQQRLVDEKPSRAEHRHTLARYQSNLAKIMSRRGDFDQALAQHEVAIGTLRDLIDDHPLFTTYQVDLATEYRNLGANHWRRQEYEASLEPFRQANELMEEVVAEHPTVPDYLDRLGKGYQNIAICYDNLGRTDESNTMLEAAVAVAERLVTDSPDVATYRRNLGAYLNGLGNAYAQAGRVASARDSYHRSLRYFEQLLEDAPDETAAQFYMCETLLSLGQLRLMQRAPADALATFDRAVEVLESMLSGTPDHAEARRLLGNMMDNRGGALRQQRRYSEAAASWERSIELSSGLTTERRSMWLDTVLVHGDGREAVIERTERAIAAIDDPAESQYTLLRGAIIYAEASSAVNDERSEAYAARAVALLARAADTGIFDEVQNRIELDADVAFDALRERADYQAIWTRSATTVGR